MKASAILLGASLVCFASRANAQDNQMQVSDLNELCSAHEASSVTVCRFYVLGVMEGLSLGSAAEAKTAEYKAHFCLPAGISQNEMVLMVKRLMRQDLDSFPEDKKLPAVSFVSAVLTRAYPCPK